MLTQQNKCRPSSVVERVAFNHVAVGSIPTVGVCVYFYFAIAGLAFGWDLRSVSIFKTPGLYNIFH